MQTFPQPNNLNVGDGVNYVGFNWAAPVSDVQNVYIAKMDYNITRDAKHRLSVSGAVRNDANDTLGAPFLPGEAPSDAMVNYSKGIIVNYAAVLSSSLVNNFRYGLGVFPRPQRSDRRGYALKQFSTPREHFCG
jgi:hypothetical protein